MVELRPNKKSPRIRLLGLYSASEENTGWMALLGSISFEKKRVEQRKE
jgi:hypothetical protein